MDHDQSSPYDIVGDIFTSREAMKYLKSRGVLNTMNLLVLLREHHIFQDDAGTCKVHVGFKKWEWRVSRGALERYVVWYRSTAVERERRSYRVEWTEREYAIACDVLTGLGIPVPGRMRRYRDQMIKVESERWTGEYEE